MGCLHLVLSAVVISQKRSNLVQQPFPKGEPEP
jgi:hypothetical protein